jgi:hypothetical protein
VRVATGASGLTEGEMLAGGRPMMSPFPESAALFLWARWQRVAAVRAGLLGPLHLSVAERTLGSSHDLPYRSEYPNQLMMGSKPIVSPTTKTTAAKMQAPSRIASAIRSGFHARNTLPFWTFPCRVRVFRKQRIVTLAPPVRSWTNAGWRRDTAAP